MRFSAHLVEPQVEPLIGFPGSWTSGTNGAVVAEVVRVQIENEADFDKYRGTLQRQDRPDAAGARGANARRAVRPTHDGEGL